MDSVIASPVTVKIPVFEGPLDLLLYLLSKNKVEITDIPVSMILDQYMEYLDTMASLDMEIASEFIVMAAQLILIKSRILLPKQEEEEDEDPREALVRSLLEYQRYKEASSFFKDRFEHGFDLITKSAEPLGKDPEYRYRHDPQELIRAIKTMAERAKALRQPTKDNFTGIVGAEPVPVDVKIKEVLQQLILTRSVAFRSVFKNAQSKSEVVAIFLAVLELLNSKRVQPIDGQDGNDCVLILSDGKEETHVNTDDNGTSGVSGA